MKYPGGTRCVIGIEEKEDLPMNAITFRLPAQPLSNWRRILLPVASILTSMFAVAMALAIMDHIAK